MLVGRQEELRQIGGLLAAAKRGRSGTLVLVGEPGIGKSALLEEAVRRARGMRILRASGVESESELPYAGLLTLTRPVAGLVPSLPEPQAQALTAALALGPAPPTDPFAVCAATLGLFAGRRSTSRCSRWWTMRSGSTPRRRRRSASPRAG